MPSEVSSSSTSAWARVHSPFASHQSAASGAQSPVGGSLSARDVRNSARFMFVLLFFAALNATRGLWFGESRKARLNPLHKLDGVVYGFAVCGFARGPGTSFERCQAPAKEHGGGQVDDSFVRFVHRGQPIIFALFSPRDFRRPTTRKPSTKFPDG